MNRDGCIRKRDDVCIRKRDVYIVQHLAPLRGKVYLKKATYTCMNRGKCIRKRDVYSAKKRGLCIVRHLLDMNKRHVFTRKPPKRRMSMATDMSILKETNI